jgi:AcrR family transcriptional regulator
VSQAATVPATPDLSRRERRKLELRGRIVERAAELFARQGFARTTVAEICDGADVAQKTFFNHFPSKQHLLRTLAHLGFDRLLTDIESVRKEQQSTPERLKQFFGLVAENAAEGGPMNRELVTELVHVLSTSSEKSAEAQRLLDAFGAIVRDGIEAGDVTRRHDAVTLTEMIQGAYYVLMFNYANIDEFPIEEQAEAVARFLGDALAPHSEEE